MSDEVTRLWTFVKIFIWNPSFRMLQHLLLLMSFLDFELLTIIWNPPFRMLKIFNWNPLFRMLKQHLMKQKMPHFFIRWICKHYWYFIKNKAKSKVDDNLTFLLHSQQVEYFCQHPKSQAEADTGEGKVIIIGIVSFYVLGEHLAYRFTVSEKTQCSTCWTASQSWSQRRGLYIS